MMSKILPNDCNKVLTAKVFVERLETIFGLLTKQGTQSLTQTRAMPLFTNNFVRLFESSAKLPYGESKLMQCDPLLYFAVLVRAPTSETRHSVTEYKFHQLPEDHFGFAPTVARKSALPRATDKKRHAKT